MDKYHVAKASYPGYAGLEDDQIRLLCVEPALDDDGPVRGTFNVASLAHAPDYEALSYTWGDSAFS